MACLDGGASFELVGNEAGENVAARRPVVQLPFGSSEASSFWSQPFAWCRHCRSLFEVASEGRGVCTVCGSLQGDPIARASLSPPKLLRPGIERRPGPGGASPPWTESHIVTGTPEMAANRPVRRFYGGLELQDVSERRLWNGGGAPEIQRDQPGGWVVELRDVNGAPFEVREQRAPATRGEIRSWSSRSRRRFAETGWSIRQDRLGEPAMLHLTFPVDFPQGQGQAVREVLRVFLQRVRRRGWVGDYLWVVELQKRGAPHFHLVVWPGAGQPKLPRTVVRDGKRCTLERVLSECWYDAVGASWKDFLPTYRDARLKHGCRITETGDVCVGRALSYMLSYVGKEGERKGITPALEATYIGKRWDCSRSTLPTGSMANFVLQPDDEIQLRRVLRRWLRAHGRHRDALYLARGYRTFLRLSDDQQRNALLISQMVAAARGQWEAVRLLGRPPPPLAAARTTLRGPHLRNRRVANLARRT